MEKRDARTLSPDAQEEVRRQAMKMLNKGMTQQAVADELDVTREAVGNWWKLYEQGGWNALKKRRWGRQRGSGNKLTPEQEHEAQKLITDNMPDQLKMKYALWTRDAVRELIKDRYGVVYAQQSLSVVLKRWGFTPQKPLKRAYEQNPAKVKQWLEQTYPEIEAKAKAENAEIYWGDETAVKPEAHNRRSYSPGARRPWCARPPSASTAASSVRSTTGARCSGWR